MLPDGVWWGQGEGDERPGFYRAGRRLPSVGTILRAGGFRRYPDRPAGELAKILARGRRIHAWCHQLDDGTLDWNVIPEREVGYVRAYERFLIETKFLVVSNEDPVVDPTGRYWGIPDKRGFLYGGPGLIDLKHGSMYPADALQTGAYNRCLPEPHDRYVLVLRKDGKYKPIACEDPSDENVFLGALLGWEWRNAHLDEEWED